jgi:ADP-ribose pyrophosphatase YjhB (NUDIX family)
LRTHRIAAGGILFENNKVLLVRYRDTEIGSILVCPGGGSTELEGIKDTVKREFFEETGINVQPQNILMVEDLISKNYRIQKTWFLCKKINGIVVNTKEAELEGIIDVSWYTKLDIKNEVVYPDILKKNDWVDISSKNWQVCYNDIRYVNF